MSSHLTQFTAALAYGKDGEAYARHVGEALAAGEQRAEVKRKSRKDLGFYIETEQNARNRGQWKQGGINATPAEFYAYVIADTGILVVLPTTTVRRAVESGLGRPAQEADGDNPTRGRLIHLQALLTLAPEYDG